MSTKITKPQRPEDMLVRVIRVAEILAESQGKTVDVTAMNPPSNQTAVSAIQTQKTQP